MAMNVVFYRNWDNNDSTTYSEAHSPMMTFPSASNVGGVDWTKSGATFDNWNTSRDGTGTSYYPDEMVYINQSYFAIWQEATPSHDVTISYNNSTIATIDASGTEVLETDGTICSDDITIEYVKPTPSLQAKTNISPTTSSQTITPSSGYDGLSSVQINAISPTKSAQTYTPTTSNQFISGGRWLTGTQTIKGDANLIAGNIKKDVSIFGVTGTYEGGGGGGGQLYIFTEVTFLNCGVEINGLNISPKAVFYNGSVTQGATVTLHTYGDYILDSITGETSGTTISFNTVSRGNYTFTMPNESVYCALLYDD